jgi:hypothetical protein
MMRVAIRLLRGVADFGSSLCFRVLSAFSPTAFTQSETIQMKYSSSTDDSLLHALQEGTVSRSSGQGCGNSFLGGMWSLVVGGRPQ